MTKIRLGILLALAIAFTSWPPADATTPKVHHWTITTSSVGPLYLGEPLSDLNKAKKFAHYPCGGSHGHPCYFKGKLGKADLEFDVNDKLKIVELMVNGSGYGYTFTTRHGISVGSRVKRLKAKEHPKYIGNYGYGPAFAVHRGKHRWLTFFATSKKNTGKVYSIVVSRAPKPGQGR